MAEVTMTLQDANELRDTGGKGVAEAVKQVQAILARVEAETHAAREAAEKAHEDAHAARSAAEEVKTKQREELEQRSRLGKAINRVWRAVVAAVGDLEK